MPDVRSVSTTPIVSDFADSKGTPLVVDRVAGVVYFLDATDTVTAISGGGGGGGAPTNATYITLSTNGTLTNERVLTAGTGVTLVDAGAGSTLTVSVTTPVNGTEVEVDFGSTPVYEASFTVTDASVSGASKLFANESGNVATGRVAGDALWDSISYACAPAAGSFAVYARANPGPVVGKRMVFYTRA